MSGACSVEQKQEARESGNALAHGEADPGATETATETEAATAAQAKEETPRF